MEQNDPLRAISTPPAPAQPHTKAQACEHCSSQLLAVGNRNETGLLLTDLYNTYGNRPYHSTATPAFAPAHWNRPHRQYP
jgi:hypothetical protein